ncbi:hypothetical protein [Roseomonas sp. KE0001]|uniref:hypothetical protein n=1 Tax=Roseomonas sp. KE0001 TaxID=2479201 RepID=UPI0018E055F3|nr:hypothetical protein [Roseomonas sp. KE0001]MBI0432983.1 hypothetical protein [Roseomonas sp. KE0001]
MLITAALAPMAVAPVVAKVIHIEDNPDAELITLCQRVLNIEDTWDRLFELECEADDAGDKVERDRFGDAQRALVPEMNETLEALHEIPAQTTAGLVWKAKVMRRRVQTDLDGDALNSEEEAVRSLTEDVLRLLEGRA